MGSNKRYDKCLVFDIEATCWENKQEQGDQQPEIIQIGVCSLQIAKKIVGANYGVEWTAKEIKVLDDQKNYIIKPKRSTIGEYCTKLTGITPKMVKSGMPLNDACNSIIKMYGPKSRVFASFGVGDKIMLEKECLEKQAKFPFSLHYIDISDLFHLRTKYACSGVGLKSALKEYCEPFIGTEHSAADDAYNAAALLKHLLK